MPNTWIKERGTGVHKRHLCKSKPVADYLVTGFGLIADTRYPTPYFKAKDGRVVIRAYPDGYEVLVNFTDMKATVDAKVKELLHKNDSPLQ